MNTNNTQAAEQHAAKRRWLNAHEEGYHKAMGNRQVGVRLENGKYPTLSLFFVQIASRVYGDS